MERQPHHRDGRRHHRGERLERAILEISAREERRIGQDLHDGLGQHLTGIAFMGKVQEAKLDESLVRGR